MAEVNKRQALVPEGATVLDNPRGTAPGLWIEEGERIVVLAAGTSERIESCVFGKCVERFARRAGGVQQVVQEMRVVGMGESDLEQRIREIYIAYPEVNTTILASPGEIQIHLRVWTSDRGRQPQTC